MIGGASFFEFLLKARADANRSRPVGPPKRPHGPDSQATPIPCEASALAVGQAAIPFSRAAPPATVSSLGRVSGRFYEVLHTAIGKVFAWATPIVAEQMREKLSYEERRDFLKIHRRGGEPCPVCGTRISEITAGTRITDFCRNCQPG